MSDQALKECLLGTAVGDALGLPYEGLSRRRAMSLLGPPTRYRFLCGRGMISDDTEHSILVAESLIESAGDVSLFEKAFSRRLKWWFLSLPAGIGMATARACCKLLIGLPGTKSGIYSAGSGAAMRSAVLGAFASDEQQLVNLVRTSTRITHTDPKAEMGAIAIALAVYLSQSGQPVEPDEYLSRLQCCLQAEEATDFIKLMRKAVDAVREESETVVFANELGLSKGVGGYVYHCVPVAIHCWLSHQNDFRAAMESIISCGGDTDTNAAMVGGIIGASVGSSSIPPEWIAGLLLFPASTESINQLTKQLQCVRDSGIADLPNSPSWIAYFLRNLFFLTVVLFHGFRRLAPPY